VSDPLLILNYEEEGEKRNKWEDPPKVGKEIKAVSLV
jgi:hypothetical protein